MRGVVRHLNLLLELSTLEFAAGLRTNLANTKVVNYSAMDDERLGRLWRLGLYMGGAQWCSTRRLWVSLKDQPPKGWDEARAKFLGSRGHIRTLTVHLQDRVRAYSSLAFSALRFRTQLTAPTAAVGTRGDQQHHGRSHVRCFTQCDLWVRGFRQLLCRPFASAPCAGGPGVDSPCARARPHAPPAHRRHGEQGRRCPPLASAAIGCGGGHHGLAHEPRGSQFAN